SSDPLRKAYLDEIDVTVGGTVADVSKRIESGELDTMDQLPAPEGIRDYATNATLKPFIHSDPTFGTWYINMNTAMPPFDDVHVRKAMNWVVDKGGLLRLVGGQIQGHIATHTIPNSMVPSLANYDPYATPNHQGDPTKAKLGLLSALRLLVRAGHRIVQHGEPDPFVLRRFQDGGHVRPAEGVEVHEHHAHAQP